MRGGAPPHKKNLIGTVAYGWTQIGPFKIDTKARLLTWSETSLSSVIALGSGLRLYHQADPQRRCQISH